MRSQQEAAEADKQDERQLHDPEAMALAVSKVDPAKRSLCQQSIVQSNVYVHTTDIQQSLQVVGVNTLQPTTPPSTARSVVGSARRKCAEATKLATDFVRLVDLARTNVQNICTAGK